MSQREADRHTKVDFLPVKENRNILCGLSRTGIQDFVRFVLLVA